ncbi:hypothetical protein Ae201684P_011407 [Aphanomyces euteiches]|nr:hypothetical protein Ae201684P_011407 [Aphanomyces euteiches]
MSEGKRKDVFRFKASTDVDHLRDVMRAVSLYDLVVNFKKEAMNSLRASGTDEEYTEREQLLHCRFASLLRPNLVIISPSLFGHANLYKLLRWALLNSHGMI